MATIKSYTDIEQSKKLAEILPIESADMAYWKRSYRPNDYAIMAHHTKELQEGFEAKGMEYIPCWSLAALLGLMPKLYEFEHDPNDGGCQPNLCKGWDNNLWHIVYRSSIYITEWYDEPLDAAFEMICWLKNENYI